MSAAIEHASGERRAPALLFAAAGLIVALAAAALAGWAPLGFSIVAVFLFAGPHNWYEFRYFLSRMPARWGRRRPYYAVAIAGAALLTLFFAANSLLGRMAGWTGEGWQLASASWSTLLVWWLAALVWMRLREMPGRDAGWVWAAALLLSAVAWTFPAYWDVGLVYLHPLVALWFLRRVLRRQRPQWLPAYWAVLSAVPLALGVLWWNLAAAPDLPGNDALSIRITHHAGATFLPDVSSHLLVATHTFLEMLHYAVWLVAIPLLTFGAVPWRGAAATPIAKKSAAWRWAVRGVVALGAAAVLILWAGFAADYPLTRDVYFTLAVFHVVAEFPFLIGTV